MAAVDAKGLLVSGIPGTATITATAHNGISAQLEITVANAPETLAFAENEISIGQLDSRVLECVMNEGAAGKVSFTSSDPKTVSVDAGGKITALKAGSAVITASTYVEGLTAECTVNVIPAPSAVYLTAEKTVIGVGEQLQLNTSLAPANAATSLRFLSASPAIASVDENGLVTAHKSGYVNIGVFTHNNKYRIITLAVWNAPSSVTVVTPREQLGVGDTLQLSHKLSAYTAGTVTYSVLTPDFAAVTPDGEVTALAAGTAEFIATSHNGVSSEKCIVEIVPAPERIELTPATLQLGVGETLTLGARVNEGSAGIIRYLSEDPTVATIDAETGLVKAVGVGSTRLAAATYVEGLTAYAEIEVKPAPTALTLPFGYLTIGVGDTFILEPQVNEGAETTLTFWSSNNKYATIDADGKITALRSGAITIYAMAHNGVYCKLPLYILNAPVAITAVPEEVTLGLGETAQLGYHFPYGGAATVRYDSLNRSVAMVDASGLVTATGIGSCEIQLTTHNGVSATCKITVQPAPEKIALLCVDELGVGLQASSVVSMLPADSASAISYSIVSQTPANAGTAAVVSVDAGGKITALNPGRAVIRAHTYRENVYADHTITILPAPSFVAFDQESYTVNINETLQLKPVIDEGSYTEFTYTALKSGFFTINENGLLTPIMRGTTTVKVTTHNGLSATAQVTVIDPYYPEEISMAVTAPAYMKPGETFTPVVNVYPETAQAGIVWTSSDADVISIDAQTGAILAKSYGKSTIVGKSTRNPSLQLSYAVVVLDETRCLTMPYTRTNTSLISTTLTQIQAVRASAYNELEKLYAEGTIVYNDYYWRRVHITNAFDMYLFPWMTETYEPYWKAANSENGAKDYKTGIVYYGLPYTQNNRKFNVSKAVNNGYFVNSGRGYYLLQGSKFVDRNYPGNDCSSYVSMSIFGTSSDNGYLSTSGIAKSSQYRTLYNWQDLRPGDLLNLGGSHVVMFLYYANAAKTQMVIIEQGGSSSADRGIDGLAYSNTIASSIKNVSYYTSRGYSIRRYVGFGY